MRYTLYGNQIAVVFSAQSGVINMVQIVTARTPLPATQRTQFVSRPAHAPTQPTGSVAPAKRASPCSGHNDAYDQQPNHARTRETPGPLATTVAAKRHKPVSIVTR